MTHIILPLLLITSLFFPPQECANTGLHCGVTRHHYWLKWDDAEDGEVPCYAMCGECGYSMYVDHVKVK